LAGDDHQQTNDHAQDFGFHFCGLQRNQDQSWILAIIPAKKKHHFVFPKVTKWRAGMMDERRFNHA
jgi:hypothetical protein